MEDSRILPDASKLQTNDLKAASELAQGVIYKTIYQPVGHALDTS